MDTLARLSPSKIAAFRSCPQSFAFRYVQGLEEPADRFMIRGTLVHEVCERLFDVEPASRSHAMAVALLHRLWERMVDAQPALRGLFRDADDAGAWIVSAERLLDVWFRLEAPGEVVVEGREVFVEMATADGGALAGIIDRLDRLPDGRWRITDYKTSRAPGPAWERQGFFQLRFYAMVAQRSLGVAVTRLRLVHLGGGGEILELAHDEDAGAAIERQVAAMATTMRNAADNDRWPANVGRRCDWCAFKHRCPAWTAVESASRPTSRTYPAGAP